MKDESKMTPHEAEAALHEQCWELLPWWVNGSLSPDRTDMIERHIARCVECASEVRALNALQAQMRASDSIMLAPQASWQKMAERLDHEEAMLEGEESAESTLNPIRAPSSRFASGRAIRWQAIAAMQGIAILGLIAAVVWQTRGSTRGEYSADAGNPTSFAVVNPNALAQYSTLTAASDAASPHALRVVFRNDVPVAEITGMLRALPAQIVSGPSEAGVYTLGLVTTADGAAKPSESLMIPQLLTKLRSDTRVIFVESGPAQ